MMKGDTIPDEGEVTNAGLRAFIATQGFSQIVRGGQMVDRFAAPAAENAPPAAVQPGSATPPSETPMEARPELAQLRVELVADPSFADWRPETASENFQLAREGADYIGDRELLLRLGEVIGNDAVGVDLLRQLGASRRRRR